jgi:hypothetical protein
LFLALTLITIRAIGWAGCARFFTMRENHLTRKKGCSRDGNETNEKEPNSRAPDAIYNDFMWISRNNS